MTTPVPWTGLERLRARRGAWWLVAVPAVLAALVAVVWALLGGQPAGGPGGPSRAAGAPSTTATYVYDSQANDVQSARTRHVVEATVVYAPWNGKARFLGRASSPVAGFAVAAETGGDVLNAAGRSYPKVLDARTGDPIPAPPSGLSKVPVGDRVPWGAQERGAYIKDWHDQGYSTPEGGWSQYDIHHIIPREYGGTNDFNNLVPVLRTVHQQEFNPWWMNYGG